MKRRVGRARGIGLANLLAAALSPSKPGISEPDFKLKEEKRMLPIPVLLPLVAVLGVIPALIANRKGRSFVLWWAFGALFSSSLYPQP